MGIKQYKTTDNTDEHFRQMKEILDSGEGHFLIGGLVRNENVSPMVFMSRMPEQFAFHLAQIAPACVDHVMDEIALRLKAPETATPQ